MLNLDTNVLIAVVEESLRADEAAVMHRDDQWAISPVVLWEIAKLSKAGRIRISLDDSRMAEFLNFIQVLPLTVEVARASQRLDFASDPADEIIAATSVVHRAPLVTRDARMLNSLVVPLAIR
jgi:PIN domain nuclease of toxin-antitoxin system